MEDTPPRLHENRRSTGGRASTLRDSSFAQSARQLAARSLDLKQVDTWLAIHADNTATIYIGFAELGQGASTALLQVAAEELDLAMNQVKSVQTRYQRHAEPGRNVLERRDHSRLPANPRRRRRGAAGAASSWRRGGWKRPSIVCRCRRVSSPSWATGRAVKYGELVGDKPFSLPLPERARQDAGQYRLVGTPSPATTFPKRSRHIHVYMQHVRVPGMLHGRVVRPRGQSAYGAGAKISGIDEASIRGIEVLASSAAAISSASSRQSEWDAVRAARQSTSHVGRSAALPGDRQAARANALGRNPGQGRAREGQWRPTPSRPRRIVVAHSAAARIRPTRRSLPTARLRT